MALSEDAAKKALIAFHRFGLGPKPGGPERIGRDPEAALLAEIAAPGIAATRDPALPSYAKACREAQSGFERAHAVLRQEIDARIDKQMAVDIGFVERLVIFWSNHFSMSVNKAEAVRGTIGQLERDVIRKHVLGSFSDMLVGVFRHPAMIAFLDNDDSIGPNSPIGLNWGAGYNENLAREALELHTLGSGGGYTEADVSAFAKILTGWSYVRGWEVDGGWNGGTPQNRGRFIYRADWHEPGPIEFMGKTYPPEGAKQAVRALRRLAVSPATAEHIAFKLVRHFIADEPTPAMVNPIRKVFLRTGGNLKAVAKALVRLPEAWSTPLEKLRTPYELAIAQYRALGVRYKEDDFWALSETLRALNQSIWECPSPEGYSDDSWHWLDPDGLTIRVDTALLSSWVYGRRYRGSVPRLAASLYGKALSKATRERIAGAGDKDYALTILFASPEFQRR
jgi:uncharacterized protein (DUF1800 family)